MATMPELRQQLQALSIPKTQRPRGGPRPSTKSGAGWLAKFILVAGLAAGGYWVYTNREMLLALAPSVKDRVSDAISKPPELATLVVHAQTDAGAPPVLTATGKIVSDHR